MLGYLFDPHSHIIEAISVCYAVDYNHSCCTVIYTMCHCQIFLLSSSIPNLQFQLDCINFDSFHLEIDTDCWHMRLFECAITESKHNVRLSNCAISYEQHLYQIIKLLLLFPQIWPIHNMSNLDDKIEMFS